MDDEFPFEIVETSGEAAFRTWQELKAAGRGIPVIIGDEYALGNIADAFGEYAGDTRSVDEILAAAARLEYPDDLIALRAKEKERTKRWIRETFDESDTAGESLEDALASVDAGPELGTWPEKPLSGYGLTVVEETLGGLAKTVFIALVQTSDWTTIPAHLRWGGWNDCPAPEYHIAALRSWRERYGVELVGLSSDTMNLIAARRPTNREEALALAREQFEYSADIAADSLSALASMLMSDSWWYIWWD